MAQKLALVVVSPFGAYGKGQYITDTAEVERINSGEHEHHCIRVMVDEEPAPPAAEV